MKTKFPSEQSQLDLFEMRPISRVVPFPLRAMKTEVTALAIELLGLPEKADRARAWKRIARAHRDRLLALGMSRPDIIREIDELRTAVACEARRRVILGLDRSMGGGR
jgi:hypothetical protein